MKSELSMLLGGWLVLASFVVGVGWQNLSAPVLSCDDVAFGRLAQHFHAGGENALRCWLLIPEFKLFGYSVAVTGGTNLALEAIALLVCMLWIWRLLGLVEGLLTGLLLVSDPIFLFAWLFDRGSDMPILLCRLIGLTFALFAWRRQNPRLALAS